MNHLIPFTSALQAWAPYLSVATFVAYAVGRSYVGVGLWRGWRHRPRYRSQALHATVAMKPSLELVVIRQGQAPLAYCPD